MNKLIAVVFVILCSTNLQAQNSIDSTGTGLQQIAKLIQEDPTLEGRYEADSLFTKALVQTLKNPYSFNIPLDSLVSVRLVTAPDNSFRIFTWQLDLEDGNYKQRGAIQINTNNGSLKLLPLFDRSDKMEQSTKLVSNRKNWLGAIYYDIILTHHNNTNYYTLLGFDESNYITSNKIIEVMHFENEEPVFGGDFFIYPPDETYPKAPINRFIYTYKKGSNAYIRHEKENNAILLSELSSTSNDLNAKSTLVPSGNEVYFVWKNGKWNMPNK